MARYAVSFDRDAAADLGQIRHYLAGVRDAGFANDFADRVIAYCESFGALPHRGTRRDTIREGLRTSTWRRTITIAFSVDDEARQVVILGMFYRGRDYLTAMKERLD
jgi:plasmid stabilization system protein ParE